MGEVGVVSQIPVYLETVDRPQHVPVVGAAASLVADDAGKNPPEPLAVGTARSRPHWEPLPFPFPWMEASLAQALGPRQALQTTVAT